MRTSSIQQIASLTGLPTRLNISTSVSMVNLARVLVHHVGRHCRLSHLRTWPHHAAEAARVSDATLVPAPTSSNGFQSGRSRLAWAFPNWKSASLRASLEILIAAAATHEGELSVQPRTPSSAM